MYDLVQCTRCHKKMLDEEYPNHHCMPKIKEWKTIKFTNHYITKNENGEKTISFVSQEGVNYDFIEIPENKEYTKIPYQPIGNREKINHEGNSTSKDHIFKQVFSKSADCRISQNPVDIYITCRLFRKKIYF